jgi:uncharacterized protein DUF4231
MGEGEMPEPSKPLKFRSLSQLNNLERVQNLRGDQKEFWHQRITDQLQGMHSRSKNWRRWGDGFRLPALAAGAAVPALAPFSGLYIRIATAALAALAVTLNGAVTLFHTDQRIIINRRYEGILLSTAWSFALALSPYNGTDDAAFKRFARHVTSVLEAYDDAYETSIYIPPIVGPSQPADEPAHLPPSNPSSDRGEK